MTLSKIEEELKEKERIFLVLLFLRKKKMDTL